MKTEAIAAAFEAFGDGRGLEISLPVVGLSRRYASPDQFPQSNAYAPGHEAAGLHFVRFEPIY